MTRECYGGPLDGAARDWTDVVVHIGDFGHTPARYIGDYILEEASPRWRFKWRDASKREQLASSAWVELQR